MVYHKEDLDFIHRLIKQGGTTNADVTNIFMLYRRYIDATLTITGCSTCGSDLHKYWGQLKDFILTNSDKFQ